MSRFSNQSDALKVTWVSFAIGEGHSSNAVFDNTRFRMREQRRTTSTCLSATLCKHMLMEVIPVRRLQGIIVDNMDQCGRDPCSKLIPSMLGFHNNSDGRTEKAQPSQDAIHPQL
jgi:hypothetical protein